jgi:GDP-mannose 6-dehydrogenase
MGHKVTGVDVIQYKVDELAGGRSPIVEKDLPELIAQGVEKGLLTATTDVMGTVKDADCIMICVGTPSREDGSLDLTYSVQVARQIGEALAKHPHHAVVVFRSTMLPGSVESTLLPELERASGQVSGKDFGVCYNPEFLREGTAVSDYFEAPQTILGVSDDFSAKPLEEVYGALEGDIYKVDIRTAEMLKYVNNSFHALKVCFGNEVGRICKREGIDSHKVMELFCLDTKLNLSPYYLKPGFAYGGSCLPKDVRAIIYRGRELHLNLPVLDAITRSNDLHIQAAVSTIEKQENKKVGVLGLSFKAETDDLRESPIIRVVGTLVGKGYDILLHDNHVNVERLLGANRKFLEAEIPYLERVFRHDPREVVANSDTVVIANGHPTYRQVPEWLREDQVVVDLIRLLEPDQLPRGRYVGLAW